MLKDEAGKLVNAQEGKTRAQRQWRFEAGDTVDAELVLAYVREAIDNQEAGKVVKPAAKKSLSIPPELEMALKDNAELQAGFDGLAPYK